MDAEPVPRATSSLPESFVNTNTDEFEDLLDRAFAIAGNSGAVDAEVLNDEDHGNGNYFQDITQGIEQLGINRDTFPITQEQDRTNLFRGMNPPGVPYPGQVGQVYPGIDQYYLGMHTLFSQQQGWPGGPNCAAPPPVDIYPLPPVIEKKDMLSAFITYIPDGEIGDVISDIMSIELALKASGITPRVDYKEDRRRGLNINEWLNDCLEESSVILVCVDPKFLTCKRSNKQSTGDEDDDSYSESYFIMDQLLTKYMHGACRNYNVLPVLIAGAMFKDLPTWLKNTNVYRWPKTSEKLIQRILDLRN